MSEKSIEYDVSSLNNVNHCKVRFTLDRGTIECCVHSPIINQHREDSIRFPNGTLDTATENKIVEMVLNMTDIKKLDADLSLAGTFDDVRKQEWYITGDAVKGTWKGFDVPNGYNIKDGNICIQKVNDDGSIKYETPFCRVPAITTSLGRNIDNDEYWVEISFTNIFGESHSQWLSQQDALSRKGVMSLADRGLNLIEKNTSTMNDYIGACLKVNRERLPNRIVTEKNGWKRDNTLFAFGKRGFQKGEVVDIIPLRKEASDGLRVCGEMRAWIKAVKPIIHLPLVRLKMYAVMTAPLLRILMVQSFILDHNGESSTGKTFTNDLGMSLIGNPDILRFNGDTTKTAAEILAEMYTDLPLYLDETGTQQSGEVLKAIIYMIGNEQGRMRGHKDGGLRDTGTWKTVALTTGERPLTSHKSYSGELVRAIEIRGGLSKDVIEDVKYMADVMRSNHGHFAEPYFRKIEEYRSRLRDMYQMARERYITKDNVKTNRLAGSFAAMLVAGMLLEDIFGEVGIEPMEPHLVIDHFFDESVKSNQIESYSQRALQVVLDWTQSKNMCFYDFNCPDTKRGIEFYGWIDDKYIDIIPSELRKILDRAGYDSTRVINDWVDDSVVIVNKGRRDYKVQRNGKQFKVIRFNREEVYSALFK